MKLIKFDLLLNGAKVHNLEELRDNFTTEILELYASGLLSKWLTSRNLMTEADKLSAIPADHNDVDKLGALCETFGVDADRRVIEAALSNGQASQGVMLREDPEELKYKEKFEKLSNLFSSFKIMRHHVTQDEYNGILEEATKEEHKGRCQRVVFSEGIYDMSDALLIFYGLNSGEKNETL